MNRSNASNVNGHRTKPEFKKELDLYVPVGVILIELKDCSDDVSEAELGSNAERILRKILLLSKEEEFQQ